MRPDVTFICKNASATVVTESEISKKFMFTVFSKSFVLQSIVQQERSNCIVCSFACQFGLTGITLHLHSPLHCRASVTTFGLITIGSSTLSNVRHSSMLLVINMTVAGRQMSYVYSP